MTRTGSPWDVSAAIHRTLGQHFGRLIQYLLLHSAVEAYGQPDFKKNPKAPQDTPNTA